MGIFKKINTADLIKDSIERTQMFSLTVPLVSKIAIDPITEVIDFDSVTALKELHKIYPKKKICILNFANYTTPGGGYLHGAIAQEEDLCRASFLYSVLKEFDSTYYAWNREHLNNNLYEDRALYSPDIVFDGRIKADVLTCAAPYKIQDEDTIRKRIRFIKAILAVKAPDIFITGAWGCGVFEQDPKMISRYFKEEFEISPVKIIIYAIPGGKNYDVFKHTMIR